MICREENNYNRINLPEAIIYTNGTATYLYGTDGIKRRTSITEGEEQPPRTTAETSSTKTTPYT